MVSDADVWTDTVSQSVDSAISIGKESVWTMALRRTWLERAGALEGHHAYRTLIGF
jgi:hypothetical protein